MMQTDMKTKMRVLTLALLALACVARGENFRWGNSNKNNRVKTDTYGSTTYMNPNNARAYLYLGEAKVVPDPSDKNKTLVSLDGLIYVCDATARGSSNSSFGDYDTTVSSDLILAEGGQVYSLIVVSLNSDAYRKQYKAGQKIEAGEYLSVAVKTGTSKAKTDGSGNKYMELVMTEQITNPDNSLPGKFVETVEPVKDGGYVWGSSEYSKFKVWDQFGQVRSLTEDYATTYLYLGKVEVEDNKINLAKYKFITNSVPQSSSYSFGNYLPPVKANTRWFDDRIDFTQAQDFSILVVAKTSTEKMPIEPYKGYVGRLVGIIHGTSQQAETVDGAKYANMVVSSSLSERTDYRPTKEDVTAGVPGVTFVNEPGVMVIFH